jgi:Tfp pilus assembly protein PilV
MNTKNTAQNMAINLTASGIAGCIRNAERQIERIERAQANMADDLARLVYHYTPTPMQAMSWSDTATARAQSREEWAAKLETAQKALEIRTAMGGPSWRGR